MGWWFGRILTFEVVADPEPLQLKVVLGDATAGAIECDATPVLGGYAAIGRTVREAIEPLVESFAVDLVEEGPRLRSPPAATAIVAADHELGCAWDGSAVAPREQEQVPARSLPAALMLTYYDPERDYQTGQARSETFGEVPTEARLELPAVLSAIEARSLAEQMMARRWAHRDQVTVRLPPSFAALAPGASLQLPGLPTRWQARQVTIDGLVTVAELRPAWRSQAALVADPGRALPTSDIVAGELALALIELPDLTGQASAVPTMYLAATTSSPGWKAPSVEISVGAFNTVKRAASRKTVMGAATTTLAQGQAELIDAINNVDVQLIDESHWLTNCDDDALVGGTNLALVGDELIQFGAASAIGPGRFRLSRLLRGRGGTEWATQTHMVGEMFLLISRPSLQPISVPNWARGSLVTAVPATGGPGASRVSDWRSVRPPAPVKLAAAVTAAGDLQIRWTRRSRVGFAWVDDIDAPLGEQSEAYAVKIEGATESIERQSAAPSTLIAQSELASLGSGPLQISVRQIGDWAASVAAEASVTLP